MEVIQIKQLEAVRNTNSGTFLKYMDNQDVYMPIEEQRGKITIGDKYLVIIYKDQGKYFASERIDAFLSDKTQNFKEETLVDVIVYDFSPLGIKVAVEDKYLGLIYTSETFKDIHIGDRFKAFIKKIRQDGRIDLAMNKGGYRNFINDATIRILAELKSSKGFLPFNDDSSAESIHQKFEMSKKVFKQSIGRLYKERKINITETGIKLINSY